MVGLQLLIEEIEYTDPLLIFNCFAQDKGSVFLDSADALNNVAKTNRYSYIAIDPFSIISSENNAGEDPFSLISKELANFSISTRSDLPPFQGGAVGYLGYDLCHHLEKIPYPRTNDMEFDGLIFGLYDLVISFDREQRRAWVISSGLPEQNNEHRKERATMRLNSVLKKISAVSRLPELSKAILKPDKIQANFSEDGYLQSINQVIQYIRAGDIFEANLSQRFFAELPSELPAFDLYRRLRIINPAPFSAFLYFGETTIVSASPERFLQLNKGLVETRPIKGTRKRGVTPEEDEALANELRLSAKDSAENIMIVDLMRNDLSKVCDEHTIKVPQLCKLETFATVHHLVSVIVGKMKEGMSAIDLLRATFPGGSITGAPKIRAMEIIAEIEPNQRGPYCGSIGYIGFDGCMNTSITIRTYAIKNNKLTFQGGGAIVLGSDPQSEYDETLNKVFALKYALLNEVKA